MKSERLAGWSIPHNGKLTIVGWYTVPSDEDRFEATLHPCNYNEHQVVQDTLSNLTTQIVTILLRGILCEILIQPVQVVDICQKSREGITCIREFLHDFATGRFDISRASTMPEDSDWLPGYLFYYCDRYRDDG